MAYYKVKLKTNGGKASPLYKYFLIQNVSDKVLSNWSVLSTVPADSLNCVNGTASYKACVYYKICLHKSYGYLKAKEDKTILNFRVVGILMKTVNTSFICSS